MIRRNYLANWLANLQQTEQQQQVNLLIGPIANSATLSIARAPGSQTERNNSPYLSSIGNLYVLNALKRIWVVLSHIPEVFNLLAKYNVMETLQWLDEPLRKKLVMSFTKEQSPNN